MPKRHENKNFHFTFDNYYSNLYTLLYLNNKNIENEQIKIQEKLFDDENND